MKPSWDDAPEWANYLAQDGTGHWYWYKEKPEKSSVTSCWVSDEDWKSADTAVKTWEGTLEKNPNKPKSFIWELLPDWVQYVAMDSDGEWWAYSRKPHVRAGKNEWDIDSFTLKDTIACIDDEFILVDWKKSLLKRP